MRGLPFALAVLVIVAVLIRPDLLPYAAAGVSVPVAVWAWERRRRTRRDERARTAPLQSRRRVILTACGVLVAALVASVVLVTAVDQGPDHAPSPGPDPADSLRVDGSYLVRLQLARGPELRIEERVTIPDASFASDLGARETRRVPPALDRALPRRGWQIESLAGTGRRYRRSRTQKLDVSGFLPAERTNRFVLPASIHVRLGRRDRVVVLLQERSRVILDAPRNAIGDTFPASERSRRPGGGERIAMTGDEFGDPVEFEVRSQPFRNQVLVKTVDVTLWAPFGWILAITASLISDRVRDIITSWAKRLLDRLRRRPPPSPIAGGADPGG